MGYTSGNQITLLLFPIILTFPNSILLAAVPSRPHRRRYRQTQRDLETSAQYRRLRTIRRSPVDALTPSRQEVNEQVNARQILVVLVIRLNIDRKLCTRNFSRQFDGLVDVVRSRLDRALDGCIGVSADAGCTLVKCCGFRTLRKGERLTLPHRCQSPFAVA